MSSTPNVPVWIDDVKHLEGFEMARCVYLSLIADTSRREEPILMPLSADALGAELGELGLLVMSLEAIVTGPAGRAHFESAADFEGFYDLVAERERRAAEPMVGWDLELGFIWLPSAVILPALASLEDTDEAGSGVLLEPKGQALRVEINLFLEALAASTEERVPSGTRFVEIALADPALALELVRPSPAETRALIEFSRTEVERARADLDARQTDPTQEVLLWRDESERLMRGDRPLKGEGDV